MDGLKNRFNLRNSAFFVLFVGIVACHSQNTETKKSQKFEQHGFFSSTVYKNVLKKYKDKDEVLGRDRVFFTLIGEDGILDNSNFDFYALSIYKGRGDSIFKVSVLKSQEGISCAIYKEVMPNSRKYSANEEKGEQIYTIKATLRIIQKQDWIPFNSYLETNVNLIKERLPLDYDAPFHFVIYFNGEKFYRFTTFQIDEKQMDSLNNLFENSLLFK